MLSILIRRALPLLAFVISSQLYAQQFQILKTETREGKVIVDFRINGKYEKERYRIRLFSSHDNFQQPLQEISGPIAGGQEITNANQTFQVVWDAQKELREYEGNIQLELRGEVTYVPVHSNQQLSAKQTKPTTILWNGGNPQDQVKIEVIQYDQVVKELDRVPNTGRYTWQVTKETPKGNEYRLRLTNLNNTGEVYESPVFKVSKKGSPLAIIAPIAAVAVGGGVYVLTIMGGEEGPEPLPDAIGTPTN